MAFLATFLSAFAPAEDLDPSSRTAQQKKTATKKEIHNALTSNIPVLTYSFGVDRNEAINAFFQKQRGTEQEYAIRKVARWINEDMPADEATRMLSVIRRTMEADIAADASQAISYRQMYRIIEQHAEKGSPIDDTWKTLETVTQPDGHMFIEVVKNSLESYAFVENVTKGKLKIGYDEILYVVHLDDLVYEGYEGDDIAAINQANRRLKSALLELQGKYKVRYIVACSPFAKDFFEKDELYALLGEFQKNTRGYRNLQAEGNFSDEEEIRLQQAVAEAHDDATRTQHERALKKYNHGKFLLSHPEAIEFGAKKVESYLAQ